MDNSTHGGVGHLLKMAKTQCGAAVAFAALRKAEGGFAIATFPSLLAEPAWTVETIDELVHQTWEDPALAGGQVIVLSGRVFGGMWSGQVSHTKLAAAALSDFETPDKPWGVLCVAEPLTGHFEQDQLSLLCNLAVRLVAYLRARQELLEGAFAFDLTAVLEAKAAAAAAESGGDDVGAELEPLDAPGGDHPSAVSPPDVGTKRDAPEPASSNGPGPNAPLQDARPQVTGSAAGSGQPPVPAAPGNGAPAADAPEEPAVRDGLAGSVSSPGADWALMGAFDAEWAEAGGEGEMSSGLFTVQAPASVSDPLPTIETAIKPSGGSAVQPSSAATPAPLHGAAEGEPPAGGAPGPKPQLASPGEPTGPPAPPKWVDAPDLQPAAVIAAPQDTMRGEGGTSQLASRSQLAGIATNGEVEHARGLLWIGDRGDDRRGAPRPVADRTGALGTLLAPDPVTGTATIASLLSYLGEALGRARASDDLVAVVLIAPDPTPGCMTLSDEAAQLVAGALRHHVRGRDLVARAGSNLFTIGLTLTPDSVSAETIGERMVNAIMAASQSSPGILLDRPALATATADATSPVTAELLFQEGAQRLDSR